MITTIKKGDFARLRGNDKKIIVISGMYDEDKNLTLTLADGLNNHSTHKITEIESITRCVVADDCDVSVSIGSTGAK